MNPIEHARKMRPIVERAAQSLDDNTALTAVSLYPKWTPDTTYPGGYKDHRGGSLYRCTQEHTALTGWEPENAAALWEQICETHTGELDDPIPYSGNMALTVGMHYIQSGVIYRCFRNTINPVYNHLGELVGIYVEVV